MSFSVMFEENQRETKRKSPVGRPMACDSAPPKSDRDPRTAVNIRLFQAPCTVLTKPGRMKDDSPGHADKQLVPMVS